MTRITQAKCRLKDYNVPEGSIILKEMDAMHFLTHNITQMKSEPISSITYNPITSLC